MGITSIEWTDRSINPIRASKLNISGSGFSIDSESFGHYCEKISPGCANCYASNLQRRFNMPPFRGAKRADVSTMTVQPFLSQKALDEVLKRRKPTKWFWCDMTDMFGQWVPDEWIDRCFEVMENTPQHTHQILTKRPDRMAEYTGWRWGKREDGQGSRIPARNVWLGTSVENQATCSRLLFLTKCPAAVRFVSFEPLLERVIAHKYFALCKCGGYGGFHGFTACPNTGGVAQTCERTGCEKLRPLIHWAIVGGESGPSARDAHIGHGSSIVDQCRAAGIPVFRKQLGSVPLLDYYEHDDSLREWALSGVYEVWEPTSRGEWYLRTDNDRYQPPPGTVIRVKLKHRKGGDPAEWHESLRVREFPTEAAR